MPLRPEGSAWFTKSGAHRTSSRFGSPPSTISPKRCTTDLFSRRLTTALPTNSGSASTHGCERGAHFLAEDLRLFPGGEVASLGSLVAVHDVRIEGLDPTARRTEDFAGELR